MNRHLKPLLVWALVASTPAVHAQIHSQHQVLAPGSSPPHAVHSMANMGGMSMPALPPGSPAAAYQRAMDSVMTVMDTGMRQMGGVPPTDIDASFAAMMAPHHQGAVDMARLQLLYGKDPELRRLAQNIIAEQQVEIQQMQAWLRKHLAATTSTAPTPQP